jgi:diguanylate cyclase (GGDEF)-like protein
MTGPKQKRSLSLTDDNVDLTSTIRRLTLPVMPANDPFDAVFGTALLLCRDASSRKWGRRWLTQAGLETDVPHNPQDGLKLARAQHPSVILVEAGLRNESGAPVVRELADAADIQAPVIVLCANSRETTAMLETDVFDVARKPFEWQLISRRALTAARLKRAEAELEKRTESLEQALVLADVARQQLRSRESFEPVTGLPNKSKFIELLRRGMTAVRRDQNALGVMVIGFNRFRLVIEAMGQEQADRVIAKVGRMLARSLQSADSPTSQVTGLRTAAAASLDQFRFALMITCSGDDDNLRSFQRQLLDTLSAPVQVDGQTVYLSACLGVAIYPQDADDPDSLLQRADNAMREAQSRGGGFKYYCAESDAAAGRKLRIEHMLHEALARRELTLAYQPITSVADGRVLAAEALLRWRLADGTCVSPAEFVPIAEESGLIKRVGEFALDEACRQLSAWHAQGIRVPHICVNLAKTQLIAPGFMTTVKQTLDRHGLSPEQLELEISERGVLSGDFEIIAQLEELHALGVRLSVDDFGTGDSAIAYLKELPVNVLKIDRSYVSGLTDNPKDQAMVSAMVALGQKLGLRIVAEGVETHEQLDILRDLDCDAFQGFLVSRPVPADGFAALLKKPARP